MTLREKATLAAFNKAVDIGFKKIKKNPREGMLDIVGIIDKYMMPKSEQENSGKKAIENIRREFADPNSSWVSFATDMVNDVDENVIKHFVTNVGFNAAYKGNKKRCKLQREENCNIPWAILFDPTSACNLKCTGCWAAEYGHKQNLSFEDIDSIVTQGKALGTHMYIYTGGEPLVRKADLIRMAQENARTECERMTTRAERTASVLRLLAEKLGLPEPPGRIEAYDISNTGASDIVAAMTVFADGKPKKSAYRYFLLRDLDGPDDYASMDQVISRRFKREIDGDERFARHPDLLLIDGGQTHAAVARRAMEQYGLDIPTFGMVKDDRHRTRALVTPEGREIGIQGAPALFAFIGQIQEETHRSAVGYHHKRHTKTGLGSALEKIPGIGPARRKQLLKSFGSVKAIRAASLPALMEVVPSAAARAVWQHFHAAPEKTNEED